MFTVLLVLIYLAFISLGLPDALLGSAWPVLSEYLGVPISYAGILSMIVTGGTIVSSIFADKLIRKVGTGLITVISVGMTACALLGYSLSKNFAMLCVMAVPLGLGAGAVDASLNNFVSQHYQAKHMNWLHCFWGVGATLGPYILSVFLQQGDGWKLGYRTVSFIQFALVAILIFSMPLWKKVESNGDQLNSAEYKPLSIADILKLPAAKETFLSFFCYSAIESTTGLWGSTFLVASQNVSVQNAAKWISFYYLGITFGRMLSGFLSIKLSIKTMVRFGLFCIGIGIFLMLSAPVAIFNLFGLMLIGFGCAPIFPSLLHATPTRFGAQNAPSIMGIQMASAYIGATFIPPLFGILTVSLSPAILPTFLLIILSIFIIFTEQVNAKINKQ